MKQQEWEKEQERRGKGARCLMAQATTLQVLRMPTTQASQKLWGFQSLQSVTLETLKRYVERQKNR